ncbi:hypothetical protein B0H14DRAFT_2567149 [Mycena olivaceomarginata]|nr:hypothetical protein B0H14DRAFT_2567149 [Mycena olivaceomarginata]
MPTDLTKMEAYVLGAWGVLCAQFAHYTSCNKRDSVWIKLFVAGLALMTTLKSLQSLGMTWIQNIATFGNLEAGSNLLSTHWLSKINLALEAITHRVLRPDVFLPSSLGLVSGLVTFRWSRPQSGVCLHHWHGLLAEAIDFAFIVVGVHLGIILCGDSVLTGSTIFCLLVRIQSLPTRSILNSLRRVTLQSAAPAALCALIDFAVDMRITTTIWEPPLVLLAFITGMVLPYMYTWSVMWTLNSREEICLAAVNCPYTFNLGLSVGSSNSETTQGQHQGNPEPMARVEKAQPDGPPESMA